MSKPKQGISSILLSIAEIVIGILLFINPVGFTSGIIVACDDCLIKIMLVL